MSKYVVRTRDEGAEWTEVYSSNKRANAERKAKGLPQGQEIEVVRDGVTAVWTNVDEPAKAAPVGPTDEEAIAAGWLDPDDRMREITVWTVTKVDRGSRHDEMTGYNAHDKGRYAPVDHRPKGALRGTWHKTATTKIDAYKQRTEQGPVLQRNDGEGWTDVRSFASASQAARRGRVIATHETDVPTRVVKQDTTGEDAADVVWESSKDDVVAFAHRWGLALQGVRGAGMTQVAKVAAAFAPELEAKGYVPEADDEGDSEAA